MDRIDLGHAAWLMFEPRFLRDDDHWLTGLTTSLPLRRERLTVFGRHHLTPRLTSSHGDPGCAYTYSGRRFEPRPWTAQLGLLRTRLRRATGYDFNAVLTNLYSPAGPPGRRSRA